MRNQRLRAVARWVCTVAALVFVAAAVFSLFRSAEYGRVSKDGGTRWGLMVAGGRLILTEERAGDVTTLSIQHGWHVWRRDSWSWINNGSISGSREGTNGWWKWGAGFFCFRTTGPLWSQAIGVPLLYPFLLTAAPASLLWYSHLRRLRPGLCASCRYSRRGLAPDAPCPECGKGPPV